MTEAEQSEAKARLERILGELARKVTQLEEELERKNQVLEGFVMENEALKDELGGRRKKSAGENHGNNAPRLAPGLARETLHAKIQRWKADGR